MFVCLRFESVLKFKPSPRVPACSGRANRKQRTVGGSAACRINKHTFFTEDGDQTQPLESRTVLKVLPVLSATSCPVSHFLSRQRLPVASATSSPPSAAGCI